MSRPIVAWSFSAIDMFLNCPRKYWAVKIDKQVSDTNKFNDEGTRFHKEFEDYLKKGKPLGPDTGRFQPMLDKLKAAPGQQYVEYDLTLDNQFVPCSTRDWDKAWVRGKADYIKVNGNKAFGFDWKFGKVKDDDRQAGLTAAAVFQYFPDVNYFKFTYSFLKHEEFVPFEFHREQAGHIWNYWLPKVRKLEEAKVNNNWPATPNPLCRYCPVKQCPHNKNPEL